MKNTMKLFVALVAVLFCSCLSSSKPTTTYILNCDLNHYPNVKPIIYVQELLLPDYLGNFSLMQRTNDNTIVPIKYNQWGQNFRTMAKRLLSVDVHIEASTKVKGNYTVNIIFNRFEANGDKLVVDAVYLLTNNATKQSKEGHAQFKIAWNTNDCGTLVKAYEEAIKLLAKEIVAKAK